MPPESRESGSITPLADLADVQWSILGCSLGLEVGSTLSVKTFIGVNGGMESGDKFSLSLCCIEGPSPCEEFYTFIGDGTDQFKATNNIIIKGTNQFICSSIEVTSSLSTCLEENLRFRFGSATSHDDELIAIEKLTIECNKPPVRPCEVSNYNFAPLGGLTISMPSKGLCQQQAVPTTKPCSLCTYVAYGWDA